MMGSLTNRHALVTGGGTGIGAAIARALASEGAALSVSGRRKAALDEVASALPKATAVVADVTRESDCMAMVSAARAAHGPIDIVIANAGMAESVQFKTCSLLRWQQSLDVNLTGAFLTIHAAIEDLTRVSTGGGRRVIFIASTAGLKGYPYVAAYCAAKHGVIGLMRALSVELAPFSITVNAVCPGYTDTPMLKASIAAIADKTGRSVESVRKQLASDNSHGRLVTPDEVAQTVLRLCLPSADSVNGKAIEVV